MDKMGGIDYVVPMVFPDDTVWQKDAEKVGIRNANTHVRWRSWGTEELLIRLVKKNMPWLHDIIIVLAQESQYRPWMDGVRVVYHREFIPKGLLPVFNVNTIEMFLHRIPRLQERFIYGNDDMFPLTPLEEEDFFVGGVPCQQFTEVALPTRMNVFDMFVLSGLNMIAGGFGRHYTDTYLKGGHSMAPFLRETFERVWELYGERIGNSFTDLRSPENYNQYIFSFYQHFTAYRDHVPPREYVSTKMSVSGVVKAVGRDGAGIVCVNDSAKAADYNSYAAAVREALEKRL